MVFLTVSFRGEVMDILQTLPQEEMKDYEKLVKRLEIRYMKMKSRWQNADENLQEFEIGVTRLVWFILPDRKTL